MKRELDGIGDETIVRLMESDVQRRQEYQQKTIEILGLDFPEEYYNRAEILCLSDHCDRICGGAMVIQEPEYRSLLAIPKQHLKDSCSDFELTEDLVEINGVWLLLEDKSPIISLIFWRQLIAFLLSLDKSRYLFTFDLANNQMSKLTSWLPLKVLYCGPTQQLVGMKKSSNETIVMLHRDSLTCLYHFLTCQTKSSVLSCPAIHNLSHLHHLGSLKPVDLQATEFGMLD